MLDANNFVQTWVDYVNTGQADKLLALYNNEATLLATFSPNPITDRSGLEQYFTGLASRSGLHVSIDEASSEALEVDENKWIFCGIYAFHFEEEGTLRSFPSRYTFVVDFDQSAPLLHHHSSQVPHPLS